MNPNKMSYTQMYKQKHLPSNKQDDLTKYPELIYSLTIVNPHTMHINTNNPKSTNPQKST